MAVRVALIGYGYAGRTFHAPLIRATPGLELAGVSSSQLEKVQADLGDVTVWPTPDAALVQRDVDLVVITSPNDTHAPLAIAALDAGKHVVVEKPFTLTLDEARQVTARAARSGRLLAVFQNRRWDSDFLAVKALLARGALGEITHIESHFDRYRPAVRDRWRERPGPGAGLWFDLGPHLADQALELFGLPDRVTASVARQRPGATTDDWAHVVLDYGERRVVLHASMLVSGRFRRMTLHGAAGTWIKHGLDVQESQLLAGLRPGESGWGEDPERAVWYDGMGGDAVEMPVPAGDYLQFYARLRDAITGDGPNPVPPEQGVGVMAVIEAAIRAAAEHCAQTLALSDAERVAFAHRLPR